MSNVLTFRRPRRQISVRCASPRCGAVLDDDARAHISLETGRPYCSRSCYVRAEGRDDDIEGLIRATFRAINTLRLRLGIRSNDAVSLVYAIERAPSELHAITLLISASPGHGHSRIRAREACSILERMRGD